MVGQGGEHGSKKPKLSLQKKDKAGNSKKLLTLPPPDLDETCDFQPPSKIVTLNRKKKTVVKRSNEGDVTKKNLSEKPVDKKVNGTQKNPVEEKILSVVEEGKKSAEDLLPADIQLIELDKEGADSRDVVIVNSNVCNFASRDENSERFVDCPACEKQVEKDNLQDHIQVCLKSKFERKDLQNLETVDSTIGPEDDVYICQICSKNLSHFNSQRRLKHVNQCIDKQEEIQREKDSHQMALEAAKRAVLDCPMCGKPCKTENSRKTHMKKCAQDLKLPTEQVLGLIKKQEEINNLKLAAGIVPVTSKQARKPKAASASNSDKRKLKEPLSKLDEDLQVAMAMSSSLREDLEEERKQGCVKEKENMMTLFSGLKSAFDVKDTKTQRRKKKVADPKPLMLVLSEEEKQQRLQDRISSLLLPQDYGEDTLESTPRFRDSKLSGQAENKEPALWNKTSLEGNTRDQAEKRDAFYVRSLMPPIMVSTVLAGSKIKPMSAIPGRRDSTFKYTANDKMTADVKSGRTGDTLLASTQTAVVLAELAEEEEGDITNSGFCPEKPVTVEHSIQSSVTRNLCSSLLTLVNNSNGSDVDIVTATGDHIYAHTVILMARCPKMLELKKNNIINLHDVSTEAVMSVLKFVYAGEISLQHSILPEVIYLADRLCLEELFDICNKLKQEKASEDTQLMVDDAPRERKSSEVEDLVQEIWGQSYSEEDEFHKEVKDRSQGSSADSCHSEISEEDYREIMCSQRLRFLKDDEPMVVECEEKSKKDVGNIIGEEDRRSPVKGKAGIIQRSMSDEIEEFFMEDSFDMTIDSPASIDNISETKTSNDMKEIMYLNEVNKVNYEKLDDFNKTKEEPFNDSRNRTLVYEDEEIEIYSDGNSTGISNSCLNVSQESNDTDSDELKTEQFSTVCKDKEDGKNSLPTYCSRIVNDKAEEIVRTPSRLRKSFDLTDNQINWLSPKGSTNPGDDNRKHIDTATEITPSKTISALCSSTPARLNDSKSFSLSPTEELDFDITPKKMSYNRSPISRKRKHKDVTSPLKSPVAVCISSKFKMRGNSGTVQDGGKHPKCDVQTINIDKSPLNDLDQSGVDLFCTPSPGEKHVNDSHNNSTKIKTPGHSAKRLKLSPGESLSCSFKDELPIESDSGDRKLNSYSPSKSKFSQKNSRMNLNSSSPKVRTPFKNSRSQKTDKEVHDLTKNEEFVPSRLCRIEVSFQPAIDDDIEIIGDNMDELSQASLSSPVFTAKEGTKKKWSFKNRKILKTIDIDELDIEKVFSQKETLNDTGTGNVPETENLSDNVKVTSMLTENGGRENFSRNMKVISMETEDADLENFSDNVKVTSMETEDADPERLSGNVKVTSIEKDAGPEQSPSCYDVDEDVWAGFDDSGAGFTEGIITCDTPPLSPQADENAPSDDQVDVEKSYSGDRSNHFPDLDYSMPEGHLDEVSINNLSNYPDCSITAVTNINKSPKKLCKEGNIRISQRGEQCKLTDRDDSVTKAASGNQEVNFTGDHSAWDHKTGSTDDSILWDNDDMPGQSESCSAVLSKENPPDKFKTPSETRQKKTSRTWVPPSPFTPMLEYDAMNTPQLKREVQKFGVKPVGKKRMRILLKDIYQQTHQYETDSEFEEEEDKEEEPQVEDIRESDEDEEEDLELNLSQESTKSDLMEETVMPEETDDITSTQQVKDGKELKEKLFEFIKSRTDIHSRILLYEPLELDWLKKEITEDGIKCSMDKLRDFLDEKCVTFTMKAMRQERAAKKGRRGQKKGSPRKGSPKKKSPKKKSPNKKSTKKKTAKTS